MNLFIFISISLYNYLVIDFVFFYTYMEKLVKFSLIHSNCVSNILKLKDVELEDLLILNITICRIRERKIEKILFFTGLH